MLSGIPETLYDVELEKQLLAGMLVRNGEIIPTVTSIATADDFYRPEHRIIFNLLLKIHSQKLPVNIITLNNACKTLDENQRPPIELNFALAQLAITNAYAKDYAEIIHKWAELRRLREQIDIYKDELETGFLEPAVVLSRLNAFSAAALSRQKQAAFQTFADYLENDFEDDIAENWKYAERKTGFSNIDENQVFHSGLYLLGAVPGGGKTTFALQLGYQLASAGEVVYFCSYEMSKGEIYAKNLARKLHMVNQQSTLTAADILTGGTTNALEKIIADEKEKKIPFYVMQFTNEGVDDLITKLLPLCNGVERAPVIIIDYLQLVAANSNKENLKTAVDETSRKLKLLQTETKATLIVISSFNRQSYLTLASMLSFKESGGIEFSADVIWALQLNFLNDAAGKSFVELSADFHEATKQQPRAINFKCLKNRRGQIYDCYFKYYSAYDYFEPCTKDDFDEGEVAEPPGGGVAFEEY